MLERTGEAKRRSTAEGAETRGEGEVGMRRKGRGRAFEQQKRLVFAKDAGYTCGGVHLRWHDY